MDLFDYLIFAALALVAIVLALGIYSLFRGGDFGRSWSNKLMRMPVLATHYRFDGVSDDQRQAFMKFFDLYTQRGGG